MPRLGCRLRCRGRLGGGMDRPPAPPPTGTRFPSWPTWQTGRLPEPTRQAPVEGVGLFRTELCFLGRDTEPSIAEQAQIYGEVLDAFAGHKVVIRTPRRRIGQTAEVRHQPGRGQPALGVRGFRIIAIDEPLVSRQLDAIAAAAAATGNAPWVMAPMIATVEEARRFADLARERDLHPGVMIEVPAAALLAEKIPEHVEFCPSEPTTWRSTRWPPTGCPRTWRLLPTRGSRVC